MKHELFRELLVSIRRRSDLARNRRPLAIVYSGGQTYGPLKGDESEIKSPNGEGPAQTQSLEGLVSIVEPRCERAGITTCVPLEKS